MTQVLLVDDYPATRRFLREILNAEENEFLEAENGKQAVEAFACHRPDWTIMDIEMPDMDGLQATRAICDLDPNARIIVVSQYNDNAFGKAAQEAGALTFLHKDNLLQLPGFISSHQLPPSQ